MKFLFVLTVSLVAVFAVEEYVTGHENFDAVALVNDEKRLAEFTACYLDKGPCNEISSAFKNIASEVIREACAKCSAKQKKMTKVYLDGIRVKLPQEYDEFKRKYDPENKYMEALYKVLDSA
ncbi:unnamed protein product [Diatraea saccharalis]|uniref:Chemosensory protein n=1 Tax=Diatraea saccharalis TaxID=40085 RepID=A0A9N9RFU7_9NEOP|nr:unnamed protein product [Diatraea saccharalis]